MYRRAVMLETALDLIGEEGSSAVAVRSVCRRAGLNDRYFYESFETRDQMLRTLYEEVAAEAFGAMATAIDETGADNPQAFARAAISAVLALASDDPRKGRLLAVESLMDPTYSGLSTPTAVAASQLISKSMPKGSSGAERAMSIVALTGALAALVAAWIQGTLKVSRTELLEKCVGVVRAFVSET